MEFNYYLDAVKRQVHASQEIYCSSNNVSVSMSSVRPLQVTADLRGGVAGMRSALPVLLALHNPALRERHWARVQSVLSNIFVREELSLGDLLDMGVIACSDKYNAFNSQHAVRASVKCVYT